MYKHILVAVDLSAESIQVVKKAISIQQKYASHLSLVHVLEPMSNLYGDIGINIDEFLRNQRIASEAHLNKIVMQNSLTNTSCRTLNGNAAMEIHQYAEDNEVELIVTGSHGRRGVQLLLGSTANSILHGAKCDVLAVRIID